MTPPLSSYLTVGSFSTWLRTYHLRLNRDMPDYWNPSMPLPDVTKQLTMTFKATDNPLLNAWIDSPDLLLSGSVTFVTKGELVERVVHFTDACCTDAFREVVPGEFGPLTQQTLVLAPDGIGFDTPRRFCQLSARSLKLSGPPVVSRLF